MMVETTAQSGHYDERHGGPFDRGSADARYGREFNPHDFGARGVSSLESAAIGGAAYTAGYRDTEFNGKGN